MTQKKTKTNRRKSRNSITTTSQIDKHLPITKKQRRILVRCGIVVGSILVVFFAVNSSFWPWPSGDEMARRFNEVIDLCVYNETDYACKSVQEKYNLEFEYCHSLSDIPEINKNIPTYAVARKRGHNTTQQEPYYSCARYIEDVDMVNTENLLQAEPTTLSLWVLYAAPKMILENAGESSCHTYWTGHYIEDFWNQVPGYETIRNEYRAATATYSRCSQSENLKRELEIINAKIDNYVNNKTVQLFYKNYDDYLTPEESPDARFKNGGCSIRLSNSYKSFDQKCYGDDGLRKYARANKAKMSDYEYSSKVITRR